MDKQKKNLLKSSLVGLLIGDALGVPVELKKRGTFKVEDMEGYGAHQQPPGTWSDDSSMALCTTQALKDKSGVIGMEALFIGWLETGYWTPYGVTFGTGSTTRWALGQRSLGLTPWFTDQHNGNGGLMRILPLIIKTKDMEIDEAFDYIKEVASITHGHYLSVFSCFYYLMFAQELLKTDNKFAAYEKTNEKVLEFLVEQDGKGLFSWEGLNPLDRILKGQLIDLEEKDINSSAYVAHTLEASLWCFLTTNNFRDAVLKAVNLGGDSDTTGAVTGGLAGLWYGYEAIPEQWIKQLARIDEVLDLINNTKYEE